MATIESQTNFNFELDEFQKEAIEKIRSGKSVIVCAPTGAGKTVIAEQAIADALANKKKVFYTTPLKALSNQKFHEFTEKYGENNVGIITGDTAKNREAPIVIMTTEIYRNMLYGTTFGSLDPYLEELQFVILDECHYMNDESRGTVWEESIIYSPAKVQVVGLSATVNNPEDLIAWISDIHGDCELVKTDFRPVPLHFMHYKESQLMPLLTPNKKLNPKLKDRNDSRFGKRKGKFGKSNHSGKPVKADEVVNELYKKDMLPAIYFVFSRNRCDDGAEACKNLKLLTKEESKELNALIDEGIKGNSRLEAHPQLEMLRKGVAAHHAGLLPNWKLLVERLFNKGLVKVVFATETLAAGINMPARTTVISSISKRSDEGHRILKPSEFLQMSGRAGRRGMDDKGYVITVKSTYESAGEMAALANAKAEDLTSHFDPTYEMVLNLLQNHTLDQARELIYKSFGQSLANQDLGPLKKEHKKLEDSIMDLQHPLCPGELGDLNYYRDLQSRLDNTRQQKKGLEKKMLPGVDEKEEVIHMLTHEAQTYPCNGCPKQKPCSQQMSKLKRFRKRAKELNEKIQSRKDMYWKPFQRIVNLLQEKSYVDESNKPTELGKICAAIRSENSLLITELVQSDIFKGLDPIEFSAVVSSLSIDNWRNSKDVYMHPSSKVYDAFDKLKALSRQVLKSQRNHKVDKATDIFPQIAPIVEEWAKGGEWETVTSLTNLDDGDIIRCLRRTLDLIKQISHAPNINPEIATLAKEAIPVLEREPVLEVS